MHHQHVKELMTKNNLPVEFMNMVCRPGKGELTASLCEREGHQQ